MANLVVVSPRKNVLCTLLMKFKAIDYVMFIFAAILTAMFGLSFGLTAEAAYPEEGYVYSSEDVAGHPTWADFSQIEDTFGSGNYIYIRIYKDGVYQSGYDKAANYNSGNFQDADRSFCDTAQGAPSNCNGDGVWVADIDDAAGVNHIGYAMWIGSGGSIIPVNPPADGVYTTHVIDIVQPSPAYSTTTSPVTVEFDYYQASTSPAIATSYVLNFVHTLSGETKTLYDNLSTTYTSDGVYSQSTSTSLTSGTWKVQARLTVANSATPNFPSVYFNPSCTSNGPCDTSYFGIDYNDNVTTVDFGPVVSTQYASTSCNVNFLGTFNMNDCVGYLITPSENVFLPYQSLSTELESRMPFIFAYQILDIRDALYSASSTASSTLSVSTPLGTITFLSQTMIANVPFSPLIKTILTALLYLMMAEYVYRKVLSIHNKAEA